jgi:hypothetical protein
MRPALYDHRLHIAVSAELAERVRQCAAKENRKLSEFLREALRQHVCRP